MKYAEQLKNPLWQKMRLEILQRDNFTCLLCGDTETELHIHHKKYQKGKNPWDYSNDNFQTLCKHCHKNTEAFKIIPLTPLISSKVEFKKDGIYELYTILHDGENIKYYSVDRFLNGGDNRIHIKVVPKGKVPEIDELFNHAEKLLN